MPDQSASRPRDLLFGTPRVLGWILFVPLTAVVALTGTIQSRWTVPLVGVELPIGLVLGAVAPVLVIAFARRALGGRAGVVTALVWAACVFALLAPRGEGDIVVAADWLGYGHLALVLVGFLWMLGRSIAMPPPAQPPVEPGATPHGAGNLGDHGRGAPRDH